MKEKFLTERCTHKEKTTSIISLSPLSLRETTGLRDITWMTWSMGKPQVSVTLPGRLGVWGNHRSP